MWAADHPEGNEAAKVKYDVVHYTRGRGLDLGCGPWKGFRHWIGYDDFSEWQDRGPGEYIKGDCRKLDLFTDKSMDFVFSSHVLEHLEKPKEVLREWWRVIKNQGYLILYLPHADHYPRIGQPGANSKHVNDFLPEMVIALMEQAADKGWDLLVNETRTGGTEYSFLQVYRKTGDRKFVHSWKTPKPEKTVCVIRYGAIGDMVMASTLFPALKEQGYHVTVNTTPVGYEVAKHDPNVDAFLLQDTNQVPPVELTPYWESMEKRFDKVINLSESIEATLLGLPQRIEAKWPKEAREWLMDKNYLEWHHKIAGVDAPFRSHFYPTREESEWAEKELQPLKGRFTIMWSLSGSAIHKASPWVDEVIKRLLQTTDAHVILAGGTECQLLECGWEHEPRVWCRSGMYGLRESLTLAQKVDLVVGTETGLLNAVGLEEVPKVILLSHSSEEMLTKHWKNTIALHPTATPCHPCRLMHYDRTNCPRAATGGSYCAERISPEAIYQAVLHWHDEELLRRIAA